ncbi:MAG: adenylyltransferase/cytidyltransferase family protein [Alphaproteobacteria bacterium]|jgi:cytidyltransferase-like protein|nr:adenylyltransferase/cytidyltransferase family protein [Alphaproteobacteria bacterium]
MTEAAATLQPVRAPILGLAALAARVQAWRAVGATVAHCHGRFDPLHIGHVLHFEASRALADHLIVTVTPDQYAAKGVGRPFVTEQERAAMVASLRCVDVVAVNEWPTAIELLDLVRPDLFIKGKDYGMADDPAFLAETQKAADLGVRVHLTETPKLSSTRLIQTMKDAATP